VKTAAIYTRVSSERQKEEQTISSQTEALKEYAQASGYRVLQEWIFQDEGYSGATLQRPGLERLRDLAAEGQIEAMLVYSPDRLSRKYAYQVLLMEEFARYGVEIIFIKSPQASTPEEQLLVQFQGMIAEYERAQIAERSRRGKRHRAKSGSISVLSGAPYGYRYVKKSETSAAYYDIIEGEAAIVRDVYRWYTEEALSLGEIYRRLNALGIPTRYGKSTWDRSTVWGMLRNPAYKGTACFGKTEQAERKKVTRPLRKRGGFSPRNSSSRERPTEEWIEIPVPSIISKETFYLAQERLEKNKHLSRRHTKEPTLLQGLLVCNICGYALYRTSSRTTRRKLYYYRCLGSDNYRHPNGRICTNRPIRQDYLDELVWKQVVQLFENPDLIHKEINQRIQEARNANPTRLRKETLIKESARVQNGIDRLLDAYQEGLLQLTELRSRIYELRKRESALKSELQSLEAKMIDQETYLHLVNKIDDFLSHIRKSTECLNILDRQKILRLIIKEILVDIDTVKIKHSIPTTISFSEPTTSLSPSVSLNVPSYLLCGRSNITAARQHLLECAGYDMESKEGTGKAGGETYQVCR
jgi:site-specific DNA recombinase